MIYSRSSEYAIRAFVHLAQVHDGKYVMVKNIAAQEDIPAHFLAKILQQLARKDLLRSSKGPTGGFALRGDPNEIRLLDIVGNTRPADFDPFAKHLGLRVERSPRRYPMRFGDGPALTTNRFDEALHVAADRCEVARHNGAYQRHGGIHDSDCLDHIVQVGQRVLRVLGGLPDIRQVRLNGLQDCAHGLSGTFLAPSVQRLGLLFELLLLGGRERVEVAQAEGVHRVGEIKEDLLQFFCLFCGIDRHRTLS
jgi:Rrf2 family protein